MGGVLRSERGSQEQRSGHGVAGRLEQGDLPSSFLSRRLIRGQRQIEVLPSDHLRPQGREHLAGAGHCIRVERARVEELVRPHESQVAHEHRCADPEPLAVADTALAAMPLGERRKRARSASTGHRPIHDVVVDERERVQELDRSRRPEHCFIVVGARGAVTPVHECRPQPLTPGIHQQTHLLRDRRRVDGPMIASSHAFSSRKPPSTARSCPAMASPGPHACATPAAEATARPLGTGQATADAAATTTGSSTILSRPAAAARSGRLANHSPGTSPASVSWLTCSTHQGLRVCGSRRARCTSVGHDTHSTSSTSVGSGTGWPATDAISTGHSSCSVVPSGMAARYAKSAIATSRSRGTRPSSSSRRRITAARKVSPTWGWPQQLFVHQPGQVRFVNARRLSSRRPSGPTT